MGIQKQRRASPQKESYDLRAPMKRTTILIKKKLYLLRSIQNVNKTAATFFCFLFFLQLQSGISVNRTTIISYAASKTTEDENELHPHI